VPGMIGYVYIMKDYTEKKHKIMLKRLEKRLAKCKKHLYNNLIDLLMNNLNTKKGETHYV
tara:strand:+ start:835 stop:1014 length:180 start_codon:yes stop_codon:yes gene_type:complete